MPRRTQSHHKALAQPSQSKPPLFTRFTRIEPSRSEKRRLFPAIRVEDPINNMNALKEEVSRREMMAATRVEDPTDNVNALKEEASKQKEEEDAESVVVDPVHIHAPVL